MRHIQTHTGEKPFSCDFCQYSSNRNSNLRIHMKNSHNIMFWKYIHLANKVLAFSWKTILYSSTHLIFFYMTGIVLVSLMEYIFLLFFISFVLQNLPIRLESNKYSCPYCQKTMAVSRDMTQHIRTHTDEKPFKCHLCQYASGRKSSLQYHVQHMHGDFAEYFEIWKTTWIVF